MLLTSLVLGAGQGEKKSDSKTAGQSNEPKKQQVEESPIIRAARENRERQGKRGTEGDVVVITNEDLERLFGPASAPANENDEADQRRAPAPARPGAAAAPGGADEDPLKWMEQRKQRAQELEEKIAAAETDVKNAEERVAMLEKRVRLISNPYLAPPKPPEDEKQLKEWKGADSRQRRDQSKDELSEAREALASARKRLAALRSE